MGLRSVQARDPAFAARLEIWYRERLLPRFRDHPGVPVVNPWTVALP